jgi:hypothetical protein
MDQNRYRGVYEDLYGLGQPAHMTTGANGGGGSNNTPLFDNGEILREAEEAAHTAILPPAPRPQTMLENAIRNPAVWLVGAFVAYKLFIK